MKITLVDEDPKPVNIDANKSTKPVEPPIPEVVDDPPIPAKIDEPKPTPAKKGSSSTLIIVVALVIIVVAIAVISLIAYARGKKEE